jgi:hypothetical protein
MEAMTTSDRPNTRRPNRTYEERLDQLESFCRTHGRRPSRNAPTQEERGLCEWVRDRQRHKDVTDRLARILEQHPATPSGKTIFSRRAEVREKYRLDELEQFCRHQGRLPAFSRDYPNEAMLYRWVYKRIHEGRVPPRLEALMKQHPHTVPGRVRGASRP